jgi:hypothetical protein
MLYSPGRLMDVIPRQSGDDLETPDEPHSKEELQIHQEPGRNTSDV